MLIVGCSFSAMDIVWTLLDNYRENVTTLYSSTDKPYLEISEELAADRENGKLKLKSKIKEFTETSVEF